MSRRVRLSLLLSALVLLAGVGAWAWHRYATSAPYDGEPLTAAPADVGEQPCDDWITVGVPMTNHTGRPIAVLDVAPT